MTNVTTHIKGLKCDTPKCGYSDMEIDNKDYEKYIGAPCPKCGNSLLTQEDYDAVQMLLNVTELVNSVDLGDISQEPKTRINLEMDGTGRIKIS